MTADLPSDAPAQLQALQQAFAGLQAGSLGVMPFCRQARGLDALRQALPPRYGQVLDQLLDRMESSALFSEDSCSFSQSGLRENLRQWLDKAQAQLREATIPPQTP